MRILLYILIGLGIGSVSGTLGIGGGVLLIPALIWVFEYDYPRAAGTSLAILSMPIAFVPAVWNYFQRQVIGWEDLKVAFWIAGALAIGTYLGSLAVGYLPRAVLQVGFGLVLIYVGARFLTQSNSEVAAALAGLTSVALAWLAFLGLRVLGRRCLPRPELGQQIGTAHQMRKDELDYMI